MNRFLRSQAWNLTKSQAVIEYDKSRLKDVYFMEVNDLIHQYFSSLEPKILEHMGVCMYQDFGGLGSWIDPFSY